MCSVVMLYVSLGMTHVLAHFSVRVRELLSKLELFKLTGGWMNG